MTTPPRTRSGAPGSSRPAAVPAAQLVLFVRERFPASYVLYGVVWAVATEAGAAVLSDTGAAWRPGTDTVVLVVVLLLCLVGLRMIDDVKDLDHDLEHHPDRVVPSGRVAPRTLVVAALAAFAAALVLAAVSFGPGPAVALAAAQLYGLGLWWLEHLRPEVGRHPFAVLALAYPVQILLTLAMLTAVTSSGTASWSPALVALFVVFAGAFLQLEVARKTRASDSPGTDASDSGTPEPGLYSSLLPWRVCAGVVIAVGVLAVVTWFAALAPWRPDAPGGAVGWAVLALLCLPPLAVAEMFTGRRSTPRTVFVAGLILLLYLSVPISALEVT